MFGSLLNPKNKQTIIFNSTTTLPTGCSHSVAAAKKTTLGDVTSLNITMLRSGVRSGELDVLNVIPSEVVSDFDFLVSF